MPFSPVVPTTPNPLSFAPIPAHYGEAAWALAAAWPLPTFGGFLRLLS